MKKFSLVSAFAAALLVCAAPVMAEDYVVTLKDNKFSPQELTIPAGKKVKVTVKNELAVPAEFESSQLNFEKVVKANSEITLFVGPADAGKYEFYDDFHRSTTGTIIAK